MNPLLVTLLALAVWEGVADMNAFLYLSSAASGLVGGTEPIVRTYYIQAEVVAWTYTARSSSKNACTNTDYTPRQSAYTIATPTQIGSLYYKGIARIILFSPQSRFKCPFPLCPFSSYTPTK